MSGRGRLMASLPVSAKRGLFFTALFGARTADSRSRCLAGRPGCCPMLNVQRRTEKGNCRSARMRESPRIPHGSFRVANGLPVFNRFRPLRKRPHASFLGRGCCSRCRVVHLSAHRSLFIILFHYEFSKKIVWFWLRG